MEPKTEKNERKKVNGFFLVSALTMEYLSNCVSNKEKFIKFLKTTILYCLPNINKEILTNAKIEVETQAMTDYFIRIEVFIETVFITYILGINLIYETFCKTNIMVGVEALENRIQKLTKEIFGDSKMFQDEFIIIKTNFEDVCKLISIKRNLHKSCKDIGTLVEAPERELKEGDIVKIFSGHTKTEFTFRISHFIKENNFLLIGEDFDFESNKNEVYPKQKIAWTIAKQENESVKISLTHYFYEEFKDAEKVFPIFLKLKMNILNDIKSFLLNKK